MHDKLGGTQNIGQGKGRKKITKGAHLQTPPIGQKNYHPLSEVFLTPYPNCILEVVELTEQEAKPGVSINDPTFLGTKFHSPTFVVGNFKVATFVRTFILRQLLPRA